MNWPQPNRFARLTPYDHKMPIDPNNPNNPNNPYRKEHNAMDNTENLIQIIRTALIDDLKKTAGWNHEEINDLFKTVNAAIKNTGYTFALIPTKADFSVTYTVTIEYLGVEVGGEPDEMDESDMQAAIEEHTASGSLPAEVSDHLYGVGDDQNVSLYSVELI